ncbi:MAG: tol-pal system protein YbgF [Candidatus Methylomirabilales bacterium]
MRGETARRLGIPGRARLPALLAALHLTVGCAGGAGSGTEFQAAPPAAQDLSRLLQEMSSLSRSSEVTRRLTEERLARIEAELGARVTSTVEQSQDARAALYLRLEDLIREMRLIQGKLEENSVVLAQLRRRLDGVDTLVATGARRLEGMEQRLQAMRAGQGKMEEGLGAVGELQRRLEGIEAQMRQAGRRLEIQEQRLQGMEQSLRASGTAPEPRRAAQAPRPAAPAPAARAAPAPRVPPASDGEAAGATAAAPAAGPEEVYKSAVGDYQRGDFDFAIAGFRTYIRNYPKTSLAADAHYWLADSYFSLKNYVQAIEEFNRVVRDYPENQNIPGALLKQGEAYLQLGDTRQAAATLCELITKHPKTAEARLAQERKVQCR